MSTVTPFSSSQVRVYGGDFKPMIPIYRGCKHTIEDVNRNTFKLSDGTQWLLDRAAGTNFNPGNKIVIVATNEKNKYEIAKVNLEGEVISSVTASLYMSPYNTDPNTYKILSIAEDDVAIANSDLLMLKVPAQSKEELKQWSLGDTILLGLSRSPADQAYHKNELMLINCNLDSHIHVTISDLEFKNNFLKQFLG